MPNKSSFRIHYHTVSGDLREVVKELVQEKIKSVVSVQEQLKYDDLSNAVELFFAGEKGHAEGSNLR